MNSVRPHHRMSIVAALLLGATLIVTGCKHAAAPAAGVRNSDGSITNADGSVTYPAGTLPQAPPPPAQTSTLNPDGSKTNPDGSVTYPAGSTRAQSAANSPAPVQQGAPAPVAVAPQQQAPPPPPPVRVVPSGTPVRVSIGEQLSASQNNAGDSFHGVLSEPITVRGATVFARGTSVTGTVIGAKRKGRFKGAGDLAIELTAIGRERVSTNEYNAIAKGQGKRSAGLIGGGGGLGAVIGGLAGGGKGALIGGLAGAGAGTAGAAYTGNRDVIIRAETVIPFRLTEPITVR